jgi:L-alanine-DL-glutamate epimerase-like enolase superfamily enzyme
MKFSVRSESWPTKSAFRISGKVWDAFEVVVVELARDGLIGRGEAAGVFYLGETASTMLAQLSAMAPQVRAGVDRMSLQHLLPPGGARNAMDCALWDLELKEAARSGGPTLWALTGVAPRVLETALTLGIEPEPQAMAAAAAAAAQYHRLKVKLDGDRPLERIQAIRAARPDAHLVVDANQGWTFSQLQQVAPAMAELGVAMIEQPLPRGEDGALARYRSPVPLCADESCLHAGELDQAAERYQMINIKLDKCGGLTPALGLARAARERGLGLLSGCMGGTSLSMAPAFVIACISDLVDLDGPLWQQSDRLPGLQFEGGQVAPITPAVWG